MDAEELRDYALSKKAVTESFPFDQHTLVFKVGGKVFMLMSLENQPVSFNLKADPEWSLELREQYHQIYPGFHMNKKHWNTVVSDGLNPEFIKQLIDHSYDLIFASLTKKLKAEVLSK